MSRRSWGCLQRGHGSGCTRYLEHSFKEQRKASINELPKYLPTWTSASKSSKLKAAITSLTILQQNLFWVLLSWWRTAEDQCSPKVSRVRLSEAREGRKLKCRDGTAQHPASSLLPAQSACWSRLDSFQTPLPSGHILPPHRAPLPSSLLASKMAKQQEKKRGNLLNKCCIRAREVSTPQHCSHRNLELRQEWRKCKIFTRIWKWISRSLSWQPCTCLPCLHACTEPYFWPGSL